MIHNCRENYNFSSQQIMRLQSFTPEEILARHENASGPRSLALPKDSPGAVTEIGGNWFKMSLREDGIDIQFVTDPERHFDMD